MIPSNFEFKGNIEASYSVDKQGKIIPEGEKSGRLVVGGDRRYAIAAKIIKENSGWIEQLGNYFGKLFNHYVEVKVGQNTLLLNVDSIASRLHLKKETILKAADDNSLKDLLTQQAEDVSKVLSKYKDIMQHYVDGGKLFGKTGLTPTTLIKAITVALTTEKFLQNQKGISITFKVEDKIFYTSLSKKGELKLSHIQKSLSRDIYGEVFHVIELNKGKEKTLKQARRGDINVKTVKSAENSIKQEYDILMKHHPGGNVWGMKDKPKKVMEIIPADPTISDESHFGLLGEYDVGLLGAPSDGNYHHDIKNHSSVPFRDRLFEFHQLLSGLAYLEKKGILHGDIKPENISVRHSEEGKLVYIDNLGGAVDTQGLSAEQIVDKRAVFTRRYTPREEINEARSEAIRKNEHEVNKKQTVVEIEQKRNVFAMGVVLYKAFSGIEKDPYALDEFGCPNISRIKSGYWPNSNRYNELEDPSIPQEIKTLIREMLNPNYRRRPSATEAFKRLDDFIKQNDQDLYAKIQQMSEK